MAPTVPGARLINPLSINPLTRSPVRSPANLITACPLVRLSVHPPTCSPVRLSARPLVRPSTCPPVSLSTRPLVRLSTRPLVRLSTRPLVRLSTRPLVRSPAHPQISNPKSQIPNHPPGTASSNARVYSDFGCAYTSSASPISSILPDFITMSLSDINFTTERSWEMKM